MKLARLRLRADPVFVYLLLLIGVYAAVFSYFTIMRMYSLGASAWDLGNYNQALYTFDFNGKLFVWTADIIANPSGSLFGVHFSPLFFLLAIPYLFYPRPETILVIQSIVIAIGAVPVFWLARSSFSSRLALLFSLSYLVSPALMGVNFFDFHPEAFIPASLLFVIYFFMRQKWVKLTLSTVFSFAIMGEVGLLVSALGVYFLLRYYFPRKADMMGIRRFPFAATALLVCGLAWNIISIQLTLLVNPTAPYVGSASPSWSILGATNVVSVPVAIVASPIRAAEALFFDGASKALYVVVLVGSAGFLSLRKSLTLLPSLVWLGPALLSNYSPYYLIGFQYPAFVIPFVAYASVEGAKKFVGALSPRRVAAILLLAMTAGFISLGFVASRWVGLGVPVVSSRDQVAVNFARMIPPQSSVLADNFIFPLVSSRLNAYTIQSSIKYPTISFLTYIDELVGKSDYIILDLARSPLDPAYAIVLSRTRTDFGVLGFSHDIILLQRGYQFDPTLFDPVRLVFNYRNLSLQNGTIASDPSSSSGKVFVRMGREQSGSDFWRGPHVVIAPGEYLSLIHI